MSKPASKEKDVVNPNSDSVNSDSKSGNTDKVEDPPGIILSTDPVVCTAGYDHMIKFWGVHTGLCLKTFQHKDSQVNALCITPDRRVVAAAGFEKVRMYDIYSSSENSSLDLEGFSQNVTTIGFNKDGQWMYSGGEDCRARIWDMRSSSPHCEKVFQDKSSPSPITCATLHPNNAQLILTDQNGTIHVWDLRTDKAEQLIPDVPELGASPILIHSVAVDPLGKFLAVVNAKGDCYVWKLKGTELDVEPLRLNPHHKMKAHERYGLKCIFSPDSSLLATTSADQTTKIWSVKNEQFNLKRELSVPGQRWVWDASFTGDSQYLITASSDKLARLWCLESGHLKREYIGHKGSLTCVMFRDPSV